MLLSLVVWKTLVLGQVKGIGIFSMCIGVLEVKA